MILLATDLHLSDRERDSYRFGIFEFLVKQCKKYHPDAIILLGDLTDEKDKHSSRLVNKIVDGLVRLTKYAPVIILKGNHDYFADPDSPFFDFLNNMKGIRFVTKPRTWITPKGSKLFFIPHIDNEEQWNKMRLDIKPDYAFIHQTVTGAISETGRRLDGFSLRPLKRLKAKRVFGGDVHKPHKIGPVTYVGPPYHIKFGDDYIPRCLLLDEETDKIKQLHFECPRKWSLTIRDADELLDSDFLRAGDQIKVKLQLTREEVVDWPVHKQRIVSVLKELGLESYGVELLVGKAKSKKREKDNVGKTVIKSPKEVLDGYCKREKLSRTVRKAGMELLK